MKTSIDLHEKTLIEARIELNHFLDSVSFKCTEVVVVHGYHGTVILDYVRNELKHPRIKDKKITLNPGETLLILKSREEMTGGVRDQQKEEVKYFLTGENVGLSRWNREDLNKAKKLWLNEDVYRYVSPERLHVPEIKNWLNYEIEQLDKCHCQLWPVYLLEKNVFIGCCGLNIIDRSNLSYSFEAYCLPQYQHKGFMSEAGRMVLDYIEEELNAKTLTGKVHPQNEAGHGYLQKMGFKKTSDEMNSAFSMYFDVYSL